MKYEDFNYDIGNEGFISDINYTESTEALKDIVKRVAKKAADKAGIIPAGSININKNNIKGFSQAAKVLLNYGQSRELINRSFKGIDFKKFGSKANLDAFMNSIKPTGKFHVTQGWLIFDLMETDTYKLKNDLGKEDWDNVYDVAEMITKKANYITIRIIKELFGSREIEVHPNPIGHLLSKNGTKARLMFKLGKVKIEDGTYENATELIDRLRLTIGAESFDSDITYEDEYGLEDIVENVNSDYEFFEDLGIESEMIAIAEVFGDIEDLNEMIAVESINYNYLNSFEGLEDEINTIINTIDNLEISLESLEEGTEGFKEVADEIVKQGKKLIKAILRYFNIGLSLHEQGLKTAEIIRKVSKKTISELKTLPKPAQEKFEFKTSFISMTQYYMNRVYSNNNKSFPLVGLAENINRVYNAQGRKFNEDNIIDFSKRFEELSQFSVPQELADGAIVNPVMNYNQTLMSFGELLGIRGEHAARKCTGDVEAVIEILKAEINNVEYSPKLIEALKNWLKGAQSVIKPYKTMLINLGRAAKGITKDIANAIRKAKAATGIESYGFESSIKDSDFSQVIVDEILNRMDQDPILKLAKDKELIEVKVNPNSKRKVSINFKEIKEIEKILTPEDIQKYGGSTYQFLLKLSDTFNKNIMWNMKEIEEVAKSGGNSLDTEAIESLKGRGYYIYKGIESLDDFIEEMIMMENGLEDFDEFKDSAKAWIKKAIAVIMDFLSKDKVVYFFQVKNFKDIQRKVKQLNEHNMDDYDLYVLGKLSTLFSDLNKSKSYYYRKLKDMNFSDPSEVRINLKGLRHVSNKVKEKVEAIDKIYDVWKDKYQRNPNRESKTGAVNTVKNTILKMKFEYIDVRQNFLELEKKIEEGALSKSDEDALRAFLELSKSMQSAYLKGATKAMKMIRKMLYNPEKKPSNESFNSLGIESKKSGHTKGENKYLGGSNISIDDAFNQIKSNAMKSILNIAKEFTKTEMHQVPGYDELNAEIKKELGKAYLDPFGIHVEDYSPYISVFAYDDYLLDIKGFHDIKNKISALMENYSKRIPTIPGFKWKFVDRNDDDNMMYYMLFEDKGATEDYVDYEISWSWMDIETKGIIGIESKYDPHPLYKGIMDKAEVDITKIAKKVAEDILKTPEYKEFKEEVERKAEKDDFLRKHMNEVLKINGNYVESTYTSIELISYDEEVYYMDSWSKLESAIVRELNKYADNVFCRPGYKWVFDKPADDQPQFTAYIKKVSSGTEGFFSNLFGGKKKTEDNKVQSQKDSPNKILNELIGKNFNNVKPKLNSIVNSTIKKIPALKEYKACLNEIKNSDDEYVRDYVEEALEFENYISNEGDGLIFAISYGQDLLMLDSAKDLLNAIVNILNSQINKLPSIDGYKWEFIDGSDFDCDVLCLTLNESGKSATESIISNEGLLDTIKQKWKDGVEKQKVKRESWDKAYYQKEREKNRSTAQKIITRKELKELKIKSVETAKLILNEIKNYIKDNELDYIKFKEPSKKDGYLNDIDRGESGAYSWELWIGHIDTDKFKSFDGDGDYDKFIKFVDKTINKYKDQLGFELDHWDIDAQTILVYMKSHYYIESNKSGTESEIVQAIYDEFGTEGITSIIKRITSSK